MQQTSLHEPLNYAHQSMAEGEILLHLVTVGFAMKSN